MARRLAKNLITESEESSTNFSLCVAMLTQAHATVEGKNTENLQSENKWKKITYSKNEKESSVFD